MPNTLVYALIMLAAGIGVPIMATMNAALGVRIGSPVAAVVLACCGAMRSDNLALCKRKLD